MTSVIESPRKSLAELSPITQRTASIIFDFPQPFGPTTPIRLLGSFMVVGSTKDLNPESLILARRMSYLDLVPVTGYFSQPLFKTHVIMSTQPSKDLEVFDNPNPEKDYTIRIDIPEFTCLCPKTGQPDFATLKLEYIPDKLCVELKSLKLYVWSFRDEGAFHEAVSNRILNDLVEATQARFMRLTAIFNVRGGIYTTVVCEHRADGWQAPVRVDLP